MLRNLKPGFKRCQKFDQLPHYNQLGDQKFGGKYSFFLFTDKVMFVTNKNCPAIVSL